MSCPQVVKVTVPQSPKAIEVDKPITPRAVDVVLRGPPGPPGPQAESLASLSDVDIGDAVDKSVLLYSAAEQKFIANSTTTTIEILNGGNF